MADEKRAEAVKKFREALKKDKALEDLFTQAFPGLAPSLLHEDDITAKDLESITGANYWDEPDQPIRR